MDFFSSGHGDFEEEDRCGGVCSCAPSLQHGSSEATPRSASMAALLWLPSKMVERQPVSPSSSSLVLSGRRLQVKYNLQADMPRRRPLCSGTVRSRRLAPSGSIPGGVVFGCAMVH
jgi:hypothetical protein